MADFTLPPAVRDVLQRSHVTAGSIRLPEQLSRDLYDQVNTVLANLGGKWNRSAKAHLFASDPRPKLGLTLDTGVAIDEQKKFQFFPTPPELAARVVELAEVSGQTILEPSAGRGALVKECQAQGATAVHCIELNPEHRPVLEKLTHPVVIRDFLNCPPPGADSSTGSAAAARKFPRIVMNPPFTRDQDLIHIEHALKFLAPGGILVAILLDNTQRPRFQALIERLGRIQSYAHTEESVFGFTRVPAKTFADTDVRTLILKVKLPPPDRPQPAEPSSAEPPKRAFDDREQGRMVDFSTREDAQAHRDRQLSRPGGSDYATSIEKQSETRFDLVYKRQPQHLPEPETEMKLTIPRQELLAAIAAVKPVARGPLPIHNNLLIVAGPGQTVTLTATDVDLFLRVKTEAEVAKEGKTTVRAVLLHDIVRMADGKEVCLDLAKNVLKVNCGATQHQLTTIDPEDFPPLPRLTPQKEAKLPDRSSAPVELTLDDTVFRCALSETSFAASTEEARGILCGTLLKLDGKQMHVAACDGRRLAACTLDAPVADKLALVIPSKTARELLRLLGQDAAKPQRLTVLAGENHASFTFAASSSSEVTLISKIIDGQYPDYTKIIPPDNAIATLPRAEFLRCVERIGLVADDVALEFSGSALHLRSAGKRGKELLGEAQDSLLVPAKVREKLECGYAARHLAAVLSALADDAVEFHVHPQTRLGMFKAPHGQSGTDRGWRAVIAPTKKENGNGKSKPQSSVAPAKRDASAATSTPAPARSARPRVMVSKPAATAPAPETAPAPAATPEPPATTQPKPAS